MLRDLQELGEIGVPLYSELRVHGGYQVLHERKLPPITFTEHEAVALFFACQSLRHYRSLPFESEGQTALTKFYHHLPDDIKARIDRLQTKLFCAGIGRRLIANLLLCSGAICRTAASSG